MLTRPEIGTTETKSRFSDFLTQIFFLREIWNVYFRTYSGSLLAPIFFSILPKSFKKSQKSRLFGKHFWDMLTRVRTHIESSVSSFWVYSVSLFFGVEHHRFLYSSMHLFTRNRIVQLLWWNFTEIVLFFTRNKTRNSVK